MRASLLRIGKGRGINNRREYHVYRLYLAFAIHHGRLDSKRAADFRDDAIALGCGGVS